MGVYDTLMSPQSMWMMLQQFQNSQNPYGVPPGMEQSPPLQNYSPGGGAQYPIDPGPPQIQPENFGMGPAGSVTPAPAGIIDPMTAAAMGTGQAGYQHGQDVANTGMGLAGTIGGAAMAARPEPEPIPQGGWNVGKYYEAPPPGPIEALIDKLLSPGPQQKGGWNVGEDYQYPPWLGGDKDWAGTPPGAKPPMLPPEPYSDAGVAPSMPPEPSDPASTDHRPAHMREPEKYGPEEWQGVPYANEWEGVPYSMGSPGPPSPLEEIAATQGTPPQSMQAPADPFAMWMDDYGEQTDKMYDEAKEANRRGLWLNLAKSFLAEPGNWGQSMSGSMDALNQYNYGKAGLEGIRTDREKDMMSQAFTYSQISKNMRPDKLTYQERKDQWLIEDVYRRIASGEIDEQRGLQLIRGIQGAKGDIKDTSKGPAYVDYSGTSTIGGEEVSSQDIRAADLADDVAQSVTEEYIEKEISDADKDSRIKYLVEKGMNPKAAGIFAGEETLFNIVQHGYDGPSLTNSLGIVNEAVAAYRTWLADLAQSPAARAKIMSMTPEEIIRTFGNEGR